MDIVFTSNRHPDDLYENGLNRALFLPFIPYLKSKCVLQALGDGTRPARRWCGRSQPASSPGRSPGSPPWRRAVDRDFRKAKKAALDKVYVVAEPVALDAAATATEAERQYAAHEALNTATAHLKELFRRETGGVALAEAEVNHRLQLPSGRFLTVPHSAGRVRVRRKRSIPSPGGADERWSAGDARHVACPRPPGSPLRSCAARRWARATTSRWPTPTTRSLWPACRPLTASAAYGQAHERATRAACADLASPHCLGGAAIRSGTRCAASSR